MRKTKIVCTIGPVSNDVDTLCQLIEAGMNVARLNFSHGTFQQHQENINNIRQAEKITGQVVGIMLDTKGPEIRTHQMKNGEVELKTGESVDIAMTEVEGNEDVISITYPQLIDEVDIGNRILIDDGLIELEVLDFDRPNQRIHTLILSGGHLYNHKGVNVPGLDIQLPAITEKDRSDIHFGLFHGVDFIAPSFVRTAEAVLEIREMIKETNYPHVQIIPKIENQTGVDNIDDILSVADGIMVARGDLGVEIPPEEVPIVQKKLIKKCNEAGKVVITATQMLDSMQWHPRPTRAEANDVANAIFDGTDAVMLSGETASGLYPVEAVNRMNAIARRADNEGDLKRPQEENENSQQDMTEAIGQAVAQTSKKLKIKTIVATTDSGYTARMISKYRPQAQIVAVTFSEENARSLSLVWGAYAIQAPVPESTDDMFQLATDLVVKHHFAKAGDLFIVTAGIPIGESGTTNLMRIQMINEKILEGQGIGNQTVIGQACVVESAQEAVDRVNEDSILVLESTNLDYLPALKKCKAIIAEHEGLTSHTAIMALELSKPLIIGAKRAKELIQDQQFITLDARRGIVYAGETKTI